MPDSLSPQRQLRRRTIGLLIRRAREQAGKTPKQLAELLQVTPATIKAYELGQREPSLAELEVMSYWLLVPLKSLLDESASELPIANSPLNVPATLQLRHHVIGAKLKQARLSKGESLKQTASAVGLTSSQLKAHELGAAIPITVLEALSAHLGVALQYEFVADASPINRALQQQAQRATFDALPEAMRAFVADPDALPHLHLAMTLRNLPADELRRVAEALLALSQIESKLV